MSLLAGRTLLLVAGLPGNGEPLGLGDLVRVLAVLPQLGAGRIDWCSPPHLYPLARDCRAVTSLLAPEHLAAAGGGYDVVLNLSRARLPFEGGIGIDDLLSGDGPLKRATFDLPGLIGRRFGMETSVCSSVMAAGGPRDIDVGLNWRVPDPWRIKALSLPLWQTIADALGEDVSVAWQPEGDDLAAYIAWIKRCRLLISSVSLGCHLAMAYGVSLVVLAGPTDFSEAHEYGSGIVLWPKTACRHRPCYSAVGIDGCGGCMENHDPAGIVASARALLQR